MGVGYTVIVNVVGVPWHPLAVGVTVIVAVMGEFVELVVVKEGTDEGPVPLAASPIAVLSFVQVKVVPDTGPVIAVSGAVDPLQYV